MSRYCDICGNYIPHDLFEPADNVNILGGVHEFEFGGEQVAVAIKIEISTYGSNNEPACNAIDVCPQCAYDMVFPSNKPNQGTRVYQDESGYYEIPEAPGNSSTKFSGFRMKDTGTAYPEIPDEEFEPQNRHTYTLPLGTLYTYAQSSEHDGWYTMTIMGKEKCKN